MDTIHEQTGITGRVRVITTRAGSGEVLRVSDWTRNLVVLGANTGRNLVAQRLASQNTYSLNITYGDIGTGTATPAVTDTALATPTLRAIVTYTTVSTNVATVQFFMSDAVLANGTYREFGTFVDGSATISTGQLFNHALFASPYTKATGEDTTIEVQFTIS